MMLKIFVVALTLTTATADWKKFFGKYGTMSIMIDCLGQDYVHNFYRKSIEAAQFCSQQDPDSAFATISATTDDEGLRAQFMGLGTNLKEQQELLQELSEDSYLQNDQDLDELRNILQGNLNQLQPIIGQVGAQNQGARPSSSYVPVVSSNQFQNYGQLLSTLSAMRNPSYSSYVPSNPFAMQQALMNSQNNRFPGMNFRPYARYPSPQQQARQTPTAGIVDMDTLLQILNENPSSASSAFVIPLPYANQQNLQGRQLLDELAQLESLFNRKKRSLNRHESSSTSSSDSQPIFDSKKIAMMVKNIRNRAANFTCIVRKLNMFTDDEFNVNLPVMIQEIQNLDIDVDLVTDIVEGMADCVRFSACKPLNKKSLYPAAIQRAKSYIKCETKQRLASCVKHDIEKKQKFDKESVSKIEGGVEGMDDGDKMFALLIGEFQRKH